VSVVKVVGFRQLVSQSFLCNKSFAADLIFAESLSQVSCQTFAIRYLLHICWFSIYDLLFIDYSFDRFFIWSQCYFEFYFFLIQFKSVSPIPPHRTSTLRQPTAVSDIISRTEATNHTYIRRATWNSLKINAKRKWFQPFTA